MPEPGNGRADAVRLALVEQRVETVEDEMKELRDMVCGMNGKLTAFLVSIATAAVLLAINLVVSGFGR
jgi:hypothetical protein